MQRATTQLAQTQHIPSLQLTRCIAEGAVLPTVQVEFQPRLLARQAGQRIGARHAIGGPQHQMLAGGIAQWPVRQQAQAQYRRAQPVERLHLRRQTVAGGIEQLYFKVVDHLALAGQAPAMLTALLAQRLGPLVQWLAAHAAHQAGMAAAGTAAVGHAQAGTVEGIEQIAGDGHRPALASGFQLRHRRPPRPHHSGCVRRALPGTAPGRRAAGPRQDRHRR